MTYILVKKEKKEKGLLRFNFKHCEKNITKCMLTLNIRDCVYLFTPSVLEKVPMPAISAFKNQ